jgi:hypothetical protein
MRPSVLASQGVKHHIMLVVLAGTVSGLAAAAPVARGIIAHGVPVVIDTRGHDRGIRFTLTQAERIADLGRGTLMIERRSVKAADGVQVRTLRAVESLRGRHGTLTLRLTARQLSRRGGWSQAEGTWVLVQGTGAYAGFRGGGELLCERGLTTARFTGMIITAV